MPEYGGNSDRILEGGWRLKGVGEAQSSIRIVLGDTELARAYPGLVVGRHPALCDRILDDLTISHRHCRFSIRDERLYVEDLNSLNGTLVDSRELFPFEPFAVAESATVSLGRLVLTVARVDGRSER
jgi:predicted component of type VI protein secretion system